MRKIKEERLSKRLFKKMIKWLTHGRRKRSRQIMRYKDGVKIAVDMRE